MEDIHIILGAPKSEAIAPLIRTKGAIIGVDRGALYAMEENLKVDVALGDFDSISAFEKRRIKNEKIKVINFPADKEDTDAELAFKYVLENHQPDNIFVYNWYGGRVDHLYGILLIVLQERFHPLASKIKYISANNYVEHFFPGEHTIKKIERMEYLSYILLTGVKGLTLKNVKYELRGESFERPLALISNEFMKDQALLSFEKGIVAAVQSRDC